MASLTPQRATFLPRRICHVCRALHYVTIGEICDITTSIHGYPMYRGYDDTTPMDLFQKVEPGTDFHTAVVSFYSGSKSEVTSNGYIIRKQKETESDTRVAEYTCEATGEKGLVYLD